MPKPAGGTTDISGEAGPAGRGDCFESPAVDNVTCGESTPPKRTREPARNPRPLNVTSMPPASGLQSGMTVKSEG